MKTTELFKHKKVLSLEICPPKRTTTIEIIGATLAGLKGLNPDFISITHRGCARENNMETLEIASAIKKTYGIECVAHLPCINYQKNEVLQILESYKNSGIENILALRGDINPNLIPKEDFQYASDLISFIKANGEFNIIGACYPEGHSECLSIEDDIRNLKVKIDIGTDQLITQLFFDNSCFYAFREKAVKTGIKIPIEAGIMPAVNKKQIETMILLCGVKLPKKFLTIMEKYKNHPKAMEDAGIAYAVDQIVDLMSEGVEGIHLYTMNNPYITQKIYLAISSLFTPNK